jgi:hypothetical protein
MFDTGRAWGTRPRMTQLDASVSTKVLPYFERLCADFSTRMWRFSPSFEDGIDDFVAEATVFSRCSFSYKLATGTSPASLVFSSSNLRPLLDAMNVEDLETFAVAMPSGIFGSDLL